MIDYRHCDDYDVIYDKNDVLIVEENGLNYGYWVKIFVKGEEIYSNGYIE